MSNVIWLWFVAACFWWEQNEYFGWNRLPQSDAELIADGITIILVSIAIFASKQGQ
jgi:hypothetical protein